MIYTTKTTQTLETVKKELESKAKKIGFNVLESYSIKERLHGKRFSLENDIIVFELCNLFRTQQALKHFSELSVYLPCRISIYEENGKTILSTIGIEDLLENADVDDGFKTYMSIIFENLRRVMHSWDSHLVIGHHRDGIGVRSI